MRGWWEGGGAARGSGASHIPGLMHEAIDSRPHPVRCLHFKAGTEAGRRAGGRTGAGHERQEDGGEGGREGEKGCS